VSVKEVVTIGYIILGCKSLSTVVKRFWRRVGLSRYSIKHCPVLFPYKIQGFKGDNIRHFTKLTFI